MEREAPWEQDERPRLGKTEKRDKVEKAIAFEMRV